MSTPRQQMLAREQIRDAVFDRVCHVAGLALKGPGDDLPSVLFFDGQGQVTLAGRAAQKLDDFFFHIQPLYLVLP